MIDPVLAGLRSACVALLLLAPLEASAGAQPSVAASGRTAAVRSIGTAVPDLPGAIWIDRNSDGIVDGYVYKGEVYADGIGKLSQPASAASDKTNPGSRTANWGGLDQLTGKTFRYHDITGLTRTATWRWLKPGEILAADTTLDDVNTGTIEYVIDPATGVVAGYAIDPDGTLGTAPVDVEGKTARTTIRVFGPYAYETRLQYFKRGKWTTPMMGKEAYKAVVPAGAEQGDGMGGRILGGALMGAVLGGGGESSVELAMAGAQAAAQGGNTLEVLNSMGDVAAVRQAESARQLDETIARAQADGLRQQAEEAAARRQAESESARRDAEARSQADATAASDSAQKARAERDAAEAERVRLAEAAREKAKADKALRDAEALAARERAAAEAKQRIEQQKRQDEALLVASFSGRATTCAGGGSGVLYLQTSRPPKTGCDVRFEARCPGTQPGNGVSFGQNNYIGGSCMGIGDAIQIGHMGCAADQIMVQMTGATCN